jgi:hypothetical protein
MMPYFKRTDPLIPLAVDQIGIQEHKLIKDLMLTSEISSDLQISIPNVAEPELNQLIEDDWSLPIKTALELNSESNHTIFLKLLSQISREEYFFLEHAILEMITNVHQLRMLMHDLYNINASRIKDLKRELKLLKESLFKTIHSSTGISIEEVKTSDRILAIKYELNRLQHNREYNVLSATKARAKVLVTHGLKDSEISNLTKRGILQVLRFPINLESVMIISDKNNLSPSDSRGVSDKVQYGFSESGLKFIEACTGKTL